MKEFKNLPKPVSTIFFAIGLISALSFRIIIIVQHSNPSLVRIIWYLAVISNIIFFLFRYHISRKRKRAINSTNLIAHLNSDEPLNQDQRQAAVFLLSSINRSWENINYLAIFILSGVAIIFDIFLTLQ